MRHVQTIKTRFAIRRRCRGLGIGAFFFVLWFVFIVAAEIDAGSLNAAYSQFGRASMRTPFTGPRLRRRLRLGGSLPRR